MTTQQRLNVERWIEALESGDYAQTAGVLQCTLGFCCLGVLAVLQEITSTPSDHAKSISHKGLLNFEFSKVSPSGSGYYGSTIRVPDAWFEDVTGFGPNEVRLDELMRLNDEADADNPAFFAVLKYLKRKLQERLQHG